MAADAPHIAHVSPAEGSVGQSVTVTGVHFGRGPAGGSISFGGVPARYQVWTDTRIVAHVPYGADSGRVLVTHGRRWGKGVRFVVTKPDGTRIIPHRFRFSDSATGLGVHHVKVWGGPVTTEAPDLKLLGDSGDSDTVDVPFLAGLNYGVEVVADAYKTSRSTAAADPDAAASGWQLSPTVQPVKQQAAEVQTNPNDDSVYGYVADSRTGLPLAKVTITVPKYHATVTSDKDGFYHLSVVLPTNLKDDEQVIGRLNAKLPGYQRYSYFDLPFYKGSSGELNIKLTRGSKGATVIRPYDGPTGSGIGLTDAEVAEQQREAETPYRYTNLDVWLNPDLKEVKEMQEP